MCWFCQHFNFATTMMCHMIEVNERSAGRADMTPTTRWSHRTTRPRGTVVVAYCHMLVPPGAQEQWRHHATPTVLCIDPYPWQRNPNIHARFTRNRRLSQACSYDLICWSVVISYLLLVYTSRGSLEDLCTYCKCIVSYF